MKMLKIMLIIFAAGLSAAPATGQNFTLSDTGLVSLDWYHGHGNATITNQTNISGPGVLFYIHFPGNEQPDSVFRYLSCEYGGAGLLAGLNVSMYDAFELKFTIVSINGASTPDIGGLISVGSVIGPYDGSSSAYRPAWIDLVSGTPYDSTAISSTSVKTDRTSVLGILVWLFDPSDWNPSGTNLTLLVEPAPDAVPIRLKPTIIYVDDDAFFSGDGSSWQTAFKYLQDALTVVQSGDEIRVAQGVYKPAPGYTPPPPPGGSSSDQAAPAVIDREATFQLINGVAIYGGYAGVGQPDPDDRDIDTYKTILSGNIGMPGDKWDNSYHVVNGSSCDETAVLDGFTITAGNANGSHPNNYGAGMYNYRGSPMLTNCMFSWNSATWGGGMQNSNSSPTLNNCTFSNNSAVNRGGGMFNWENSSPTLINCTFCGNSADLGGGMQNWHSSPMLTNCILSGNLAEDRGGGMENIRSNLTLTNCTFTGNSVRGYGCGVFNLHSSSTFTNCTFSRNTARRSGGIYNYDSGSTLTNCILWENTGNIDALQITLEGDSTMSVNYCDIHYGQETIYVVDSTLEWGEGNISTNPLFRVIAGRIDMGAYEFNHIPVADAGPDQTVEAQAPWGATVTLDGSGSSDADSIPPLNNDINDFDWYKVDPCDPNIEDFIGSGEIINCNLPFGEHIIILEVIDRAGASDIDELTVIVQDTTPPVFTTIPQDLTVECDGNYNVAELNAWLAGVDAVDKCGSVTITNDFVGILNECGATGSATVTWIAEDESGNTATSPPATFTIADTMPPVITCPMGVTLECPADTNVVATGSAIASDSCGTVTITHSDQWQPSCGNTGTLTRRWTATDECDNSSSCVQIITVVDTTPPEFEFSVTPAVLWPANHKMVLITPIWTASDKCDATPEVSLVSISVNEADDAKGAGNTSDDIQIGDDGSIYLRAERSGTGDNRVYTITYRAVDDCGNTTVRSATITAPHDQR
jgi:hypothetical protein